MGIALRAVVRAATARARDGGIFAPSMRVGVVLCCAVTALAACHSHRPWRGHGSVQHPSHHQLRAVRSSPPPWPVVRAATGVDPYLAQRRRVERLLRDDELIGFKAGLTAPGAPERFALSEPVFGVLSGRSRLRAVAGGHFIVPAQRYRRAMIELELVLILGRDVAQPFKTVAEFRAAVSAVAPAVEVPDLGFESSDFSGYDLIASNVALRHFFIGTPYSVGSLQLDSLRVVLRRDGLELAAGTGTATMGSPWHAGMWLANRVLAAGWPLRRGQLLLSGALGPLVPATSDGFYTADFGALGQLRFLLRDAVPRAAQPRQRWRRGRRGAPDGGPRGRGRHRFGA